MSFVNGYQRGGCRSPAVACWASDHWVASSNPLRGKFRHGLGVPLNHPRFLEWLGAPDSAWLLEMSPGHWCDTLSKEQTMTAAMQLHRDACLMQTNLDILDQYALALHGTASKLLQSTIGGGPYPGAEVASAAPGTYARRASVQMEALGLWRPSMDPLQFAATRS